MTASDSNADKKKKKTCDRKCADRICALITTKN